MKNYNSIAKGLLFIFSFLCILSFYGFTQTNNMLRGRIEGYGTVDSLYLYQVTNEFYGGRKFVKAIPVTNGNFKMDIASMPQTLYCLSIQNQEQGKYVEDYVNLFMNSKEMKIVLQKGKFGRMLIHSEGLALDEQYQNFQEAKYNAENRMVLDSLDYLFYQAREKDNRAEMERIKKASGPYYDDSREKFSQLLKQEKERTKGTYFGLYLYYSYSFQNNTISSKDEIQNVRKYINSFDAESKSSRYYSLIEETLCRFEKCAIGAPAPLFSGLNTKGKITSLKQFKGKYVLIDFWSSGCHWCRLETPNLLKTYNAFKNKKFTILGVSSDYKEQEWKKAIAEDKSFWNQILLPKKDIRNVMDKYCIVGIPHIILINPQGIIIAKELRGDDIYHTVAKYIK